jgi:nanoRNase/pAp phosphatase (c-di-AMP/oligoRNAs hydrolase)
VTVDLKTTQHKLKKLDEVLGGRKSLLILIQDYPDPDAIASAAGLREWALRRHGVTCSIGFGGVVGRVENRALLDYLDVPMRPLGGTPTDSCDAIALVDTQPGTGNNSLSAAVVPHVVIDHHPCRRATRQSPFTDIRRRYGATSTIIWEYLTASDLALSPPLATALLYGIRSDTQDLGRESSRADLEASLVLYRSANIRMYHNIEQANVPTSYFRLMAGALQAARRCGSLTVSFPGEIETPDQIGEVAELLLRHEECEWALCAGEYDGRWLLSLRTARREIDAGRVMQRLASAMGGTGGGHRAMAGGQIPLPADGDVKRRSALEARLLRKLARLTRQSPPLRFSLLLSPSANGGSP